LTSIRRRRRTNITHTLFEVSSAELWIRTKRNDCNLHRVCYIIAVFIVEPSFHSFSITSVVVIVEVTIELGVDGVDAAMLDRLATTKL
jgi:hypothetical protein